MIIAINMDGNTSAPENAAVVNSIAGRKIGNTIGNNNIGNNPFLTEATEDIAEINVPELDIPQSPKNIVNIKVSGEVISQSNNITNIGIRNIDTTIIDSSEYIILPNRID